VYYTFTPRQGGQGQGGGQAGDTDVGGPGGSECEHAENCTKQDNPGNSGSTTINSDVTHITFKAGQDEFDVPVPTTSGETNCNAGYCVTLNPDGSISWSSDGARRDISHMQYWEGGTNGGTDTTGTTTTGTDTTGTDTTGGGTGNDPCTDDNPNNDNNCEDGTTTGGHTPITICHIPPGNPENAHTITIDESALPAHLAHGDYPGGCSGGGTGGPTGGGTGGPTGGDTTAGPEPPQDTTGTDTTGGPTGGGTGGGTGGPTGGGTGINPNPPAMAASGVCDAGGGGVTYIVSNPGNVAIPAQPYSILDDNGNVVANGVLPGIPPGGSQSVSFPTGATTGTFTLSVGVLNATADMTDNCRVEVASIPQYLCGGVTLLPGGGAGPGFPIINMDPENCVPLWRTWVSAWCPLPWC
jgi:hypothetical protein